MSRRAARVPALLLAAACCRNAPREPLITYFNGEHAISIRYPSSWRSEQAVQEGVWYRYFLAPPMGPKQKPAVSVTLLVGTRGGSVEDFAQSYLAGNTLVQAREETRGAASGRSFLFRSTDGATRHSLLLLKEAERVYGLYAQGDAELFEQHRDILEEMSRSLTSERASDYPEQRNARFAFAVRIPSSWRETRQFSGAANLLLQYRSPALAADRDRDPVHASLTLTVEPISGKGGGIKEYYETTRDRLGEPFQILSHTPWRDGYADVMRTETPISVSRVKRFYRAALGRGYSMTFEARDDAFARVSRWCDLIAGTLQVGEELKTQ